MDVWLNSPDWCQIITSWRKKNITAIFWSTQWENYSWLRGGKATWYNAMPILEVGMVGNILLVCHMFEVMVDLLSVVCHGQSQATPPKSAPHVATKGLTQVSLTLPQVYLAENPKRLTKWLFPTLPSNGWITARKLSAINLESAGWNLEPPGQAVIW